MSLTKCPGCGRMVRVSKRFKLPRIAWHRNVLKSPKWCKLSATYKKENP